MRKPLTPAFGNKSIKENEATIRLYVDLLVSQLTKQVRQGKPVVDMKDYYSWTTFDVFVWQNFPDVVSFTNKASSPE